MSKSITPVNTALAFSTLFTAVNTVIQVLANEIVTANSAAGGGALTTGNGFVVGTFGANTLCANVFQGGNTIAVTSANLGSNLEISTNYITGQSVLSVNSSVLVLGNAQINTIAARYGNLTVSTVVSNSTVTITGGVVANQSGFFSGANVFVNTIAVSVGNTSINAFMNSSTIQLNGGFVIANTTEIAIGSNAVVYANSTIPSSFLAPLTGTSTQTVDTFAGANYRTVEYVLSVTDNNANNYQASKVLIVQSGANVFSTEYAIVISNSSMGSFTTSITGGAVSLQFTPVSASVTVKGVKIPVAV